MNMEHFHSKFLFALPSQVSLIECACSRRLSAIFNGAEMGIIIFLFAAHLRNAKYIFQPTSLFTTGGG